VPLTQGFGHTCPYAQAPVLFKYAYRLMLYARFISPMLKHARAIPMLRIVIPFIVFVIIPNMYSTLTRIGLYPVWETRLSNPP
jgi:hypothetical protein